MTRTLGFTLGIQMLGPPHAKQGQSTCTMNTYIGQSMCRASRLGYVPPLSEHARGQYREGLYNAGFYVGGAMANTFPMMRRETAWHATRPPVGSFTLGIQMLGPPHAKQELAHGKAHEHMNKQHET